MTASRSSLSLDACGITDVGCVRQNNEDALLIRKELPLFVVADGVGGAAAGEVASALFCDQCSAEFDSFLNWSDDGSALLRRCFSNANRAIIEYSLRHPDTKGMACTAEALTFIGNNYFLGHVGDSRTYLIRDNHISQLTKDHSFVQEQLDLGLIDEREAKSHWMRNAIYKAVGQTDQLEIDIVTGKVLPGDMFLLCSDGLSDMLEDCDLLSILRPQGLLYFKVRQLIEAAKKSGGSDNITAVVCEAARPSVGMGQGLANLAKRLIGS